MLEDCIDEGRTTTAFAAAGARTGLYATLFDLVTYAALADGVPANPGPLAEHAWRRLEARGDCLRQEGKPIEGAAANLAVLRDEIAKVLTDTLPIWRRLGVL